MRRASKALSRRRSRRSRSPRAARRRASIAWLSFFFVGSMLVQLIGIVRIAGSRRCQHGEAQKRAATSTELVLLPAHAYWRAKFLKEPSQSWPKPYHNQRKAQHAGG